MMIPYSGDPAAADGRLDASLEMLSRNYPDSFIETDSATKEQILLVHTEDLLNDVKLEGDPYETGLLAAGGAIKAAELAYDHNETTFAFIRPPGHHANRGLYWGFCYFCNMAVAIRHLQSSNRAQRAIILDFDLHYGDGNVDCLGDDSDITIINPSSNNRENYLKEVITLLSGERERIAAGHPPYEIFAISAGFDNHIDDWGKTLETRDYAELGRVAKEFALKVCNGRRFALLEGGYNPSSMADAMESFLKTFGDQ